MTDEQMIAEITLAIARSEYDGEISPHDAAVAAHSVIAGKVAELVEALEAIDKTTFIGATTSSEETIRVALESAHDIARAALAPYPDTSGAPVL